MPKELLDKLFSMDGKVVFLTGGYRGIGLTFAETYAAAGASVVLAARNLRGCEAAADEIARTYGVKAMGIALDVREAKSVDCAVAHAIDGFGTIDVLVNCAAISGCEKPTIEMTDSDLDEIMNVDFQGYVSGLKECRSTHGRQKKWTDHECCVDPRESCNAQSSGILRE